MQHLRSFIVCAMVLAFFVVSCQAMNNCPEPNHIKCTNPNKNCGSVYKHVGSCSTYWCCSDIAQLSKYIY
ncbi:hypothetical protein DPMN_140672 [Dreissena polymorpha]|uniref:Uncharacterized protein n=1 Tax=Dreissena polymorpha TaxID=45954 RepID=A0A9D4GBC2_DREPO|nr:hypothetical protein DPMN_140672 [Dreissena polymorpha]